VPAVVPWIAKAPPALVQPALAPACKADELRVSHAPIFTNGLPGGGFAGSVVVRNAGRPCSLLGRPQVAFTGGPPGMHVTQQSLTSDIAPAADLLPPAFSMRAVPRGETVWLAVAWRSWCAPTAPARLTIRIPSGGVLRLFPGGTASCHGAKATTIVQANTFQPYVAPPRPSTAIPLKATLTKSHYAARRGSTLRYQVTLANQTGDNYRFGNACPVYVEEVGTPATILKGRGTAKEVHYLNCRSVVVRAYSSVTFAMELRIPKTLKRAFLLEWQLAPHSYQAPFAPAGLTLTK
jgi:hypothetical protein